MGVRKRFLSTFLLIAGCYAGWDWMRNNVEMAMLGVSGRNRDHITRVFVVDDPPGVWVRAERQDRMWLDPLRDNGEVTLQRHGSELTYHAEIWHGADAQAYVDELFREKYGPVDVVAGLVWRRNSVPIRLQRR